MEKVSSKEFFTVMWRGLCQALAWFFGLFGYRRDGKFAKCVWGLFAVSATVIVAFIAGAFLYGSGKWVYDNYLKSHHCTYADCYYSEYVSEDVCFHNTNDGKGYIYNTVAERKTIRNVEWIATPNEEETLVCYSDGKKRGYFNKYTGEMVIRPQYDHAWIFSEGLAAVDTEGSIKFIDTEGNVVIDTKAAYCPRQESYVFHEGYCRLASADGKHVGLIDNTGKELLPIEYDRIDLSNDRDAWTLQKGNMCSVLDKDMNTILPFMECTNAFVDEGTIDISMPDHTMRKYDMNGRLINDFYISSVSMLEYETDDIVNQKVFSEYDEGEVADGYGQWYHPRKTARLRSYCAADGFEGLMTADGKPVTMPLYQDIEAIGYDLYLCTSTNYDKLIVNGKGETVWDK